MQTENSLNCFANGAKNVRLKKTKILIHVVIAFSGLKFSHHKIKRIHRTRTTYCIHTVDITKTVSVYMSFRHHRISKINFSPQGRGSTNPNTGPIRDRFSFSSNRVEGSFAYIDAAAPRRPGDVAQLVSQEFPATDPNSPHCLRLALLYYNCIPSSTYHWILLIDWA